MEKKTIGKDYDGNDIDILIPNDKEEKGMPRMFDARDKKDQKEPPKIALEIEGVRDGKFITKYVCVPCGFKDRDMAKYKAHRCKSHTEDDQD